MTPAEVDSVELLHAPIVREIGVEEVMSPDGRWLLKHDRSERLIAVPLPGNRARQPVLLAVSGEPSEALATADAVYVSLGATLSVRDPATLAERSTLPPTPVLASVVAAAGETIVASGYRGEGLFALTERDTSWRQISKITGRPPVALSADGATLVTCVGSYGPLTVVGISVADGRVLFERESSAPKGHCEAIYRAPSGRFWVVGTEALLAVDAGAGTLAADLRYPEGFRVEGISASMRNLYSWDDRTDTVAVFSMVEGVFQGASTLRSSGPVRASADDRLLLVETDDRLEIREAKTGRALYSQPEDSGLDLRNFLCVWWTDNNTALMLDEAGILGAWDVADARLHRRQLPFTRLSGCEAGGSTVAAERGAPGGPLAWSEAGTFPMPELSGRVAVSADGTKIAGNGPKETLWVGPPQGPLDSRPRPPFHHARFSPDGTRLGGLSLERTAWIVYDLDGETRSYPVDPVNQWTWSTDTRHVLLLGNDQLLRRLDTDTGVAEILGEAPPEIHYPSGMQPLSGGGAIVLDGADYAVWTPEGGFRVSPEAHLGEACVSAPSPDGTRLLSACEGGTVWMRSLLHPASGRF